MPAQNWSLTAVPSISHTFQRCHWIFYSLKLFAHYYLMLRPTLKLRLRQKRKQLARERLDARFRLACRRKKNSRKAKLDGHNPAAHIKPAKRFTIDAPRIFRLTNGDDRREVLTFIAELEAACRKGGNVTINFSTTERLHPCGTLLFMAHIDRLIENGNNRITCTYPTDNVVEQLFTHVGLLDRLNLSRRVSPTHDAVKHWHYLQGSCSDLSGLHGLMKTLEASLSLEVRSRLFASLSEAVANTIDHAYPDQLPAAKHWWLFAKIQGDTVFIAVCDRGIGIPDSLRRKPYLRDHVARVMRIHKKHLDEFLIADAVGSPRTVTQMPHRGKGLPEMFEFVKLLRRGGLSILSQHGGFVCEIRDNGPAPQHGTWNDSIHGTLIFWEIPFNERNNENIDCKAVL